jgi:dihydropteroate synthase
MNRRVPARERCSSKQGTPGGGMPVLRAARPLGVAVASDAHAMLRRDALDEDVDIIDEVNALRERLAEAALASHARWCVCLMHMSGGAAKTRDSSQEQ